MRTAFQREPAAGVLGRSGRVAAIYADLFFNRETDTASPLLLLQGARPARVSLT